MTSLVPNAFADFWFGTFSSNLDLGIGYVLTSDHRLFQFDLATGALLGAPVVGGTYRAMRFALLAGLGPVARPPRILYSGRLAFSTKRSAWVAKGQTLGNARVIRYRLGAEGPYRKASGTGAWRLHAPLKRGENTLSIVALGPGGSSEKLVIRIRRK